MLVLAIESSGAGWKYARDKLHAHLNKYLMQWRLVPPEITVVWLAQFIYSIFEVKLAFELLTVCGQQHSFSTHERMFLWKCQFFLRQKSLDLRGTRNTYLRIHAIWAIRARYLLSHVLNTCAGGIDIFKIKLTFEQLTVHRQQHSFSTHKRIFSWKCQSFWDRKCHDQRGTECRYDIDKY